MRSVAIQIPSQAIVSLFAGFAANKPLKRSIIPTPRILQEDTSGGNRCNPLTIIYESCDTLNPPFLSPIL